MNVENEHFAPSEGGRLEYLWNGHIFTLTERKLYRKNDDKEGIREEYI